MLSPTGQSPVGEVNLHLKMIEIRNLKRNGKSIGEDDIAELKKIQSQVFKKYNLSKAQVWGATRIFNLMRGNKPLSKDEQIKVAKELKSLLTKYNFSSKVVFIKDKDEYNFDDNSKENTDLSENKS